MRLRSFTQDDAHIFCTPEQMTNECIKICQLIINIYQDFGFYNIKVKFSDRPKQRIGTDVIWDKAEKALLDGINKQKLSFTHNKGEGAFYGPKIEFVLVDSMKKD